MARQYTTCSSGLCTGSSTSGNGNNSALPACSEGLAIKQGDTCPVFEIQIKDPTTGEPVSYEDWDVEVYMYFTSCLGADTDAPVSLNTSIITLLGKANLCQIKIGDIIGVDDCNQNEEEFMLVLDVDYSTGEVTVQRGYGDSDIYAHEKGDRLIFYRIYGSTGYIDSKFEDDPSTTENETDYSVIGYRWTTEDTSHTGTYYFEFKTINNEVSPAQVRSFPVDNNDYIIKII